MSHNWISCRNAPLLTLLAQPGTILPESPLVLQITQESPEWGQGSSQIISLLLNDIPVLIQYHTRLSLCLNPSPCLQLPWIGDLLTAPEEQGMELQNSPRCPFISALFPLSCLISNSLQIPNTHTRVPLTCLGNTVRWSASNYMVLCKIHPLPIIKIHSLELKCNIFKIHLLNLNPIPTHSCVFLPISWNGSIFYEVMCTQSWWVWESCQDFPENRHPVLSLCKVQSRNVPPHSITGEQPDNKILMMPEKSAVTQTEQQGPETLQVRQAGPGPRTPPKLHFNILGAARSWGMLPKD